MRPSALALRTMLIAACIHPGFAAAQDAASSTDARPGVRVRMGRGGIRPVFNHPKPGEPFTAPNPSSSVDLGDLAVKAFEPIARRMLSGPAEAEIPLEVRLSIQAASLEFDASGWMAVVEHEVALLAEAGGEIETWRLRGEAPVVGLARDAVPRAFASAAGIAAARWEGELARSSRVVAWLADRGIEMPRARPAPEVPLRSAALVRPGAKRAPLLVHVDAGLVLSQVGDSRLRSRVDGLVGPVLAVGVSGRFARAALVLWRAPGLGGDVTALGGEIGAVLRVKSALELHAGGGFYATGSGLAPGVLAGVRLAGLRGPRSSSWRVGMEMRRTVGTGEPDDPPRDALGFTLGLEFPLRSPSSRPGSAP